MQEWELWELERIQKYRQPWFRPPAWHVRFISRHDGPELIRAKKVWAQCQLDSALQEWSRRYPARQFSLSAGRVLADHGLLRQIIPFIYEIRNLDGKVWSTKWVRVGYPWELRFHAQGMQMRQS